MKAVNAHLLDNVGTNSQKKIPSTVEFCSTPADKMAEGVLLILDPVTYTKISPDNAFSESSPYLIQRKIMDNFTPPQKGKHNLELPQSLPGRTHCPVQYVGGMQQILASYPRVAILWELGFL